MKHSVVVFHPDRQHSHHVAMALNKYEVLAGFITGVPCLMRHYRWIPRFWRAPLILKYGVFLLPSNLVRFWPIAYLIRKTGEFLLLSCLKSISKYMGYSLFDWFVSKTLSGYKASAVIAYENSAVHTFKVAKQLGMITILDAASFHHQVQDELYNYFESKSYHHKICLCKDEEIELADMIITCSKLARETYIKSGINPKKVFAVSLGVDIDLFSSEGEESLPQNAFSFIYVGSTNLHKGVDILLNGFKKVHSLYPNTSLCLVGGRGNVHRLVNLEIANGVRWRDNISQLELASELRRSHCLVLPSRVDSFGMVVSESLACGTPVIVSSMTGAKELVAEGVNGWVVPVNNEDELLKRMLWCVEHQEILEGMRLNARKSVLHANWDNYHKKFANLILPFLKSED